jgi:integrase
VRAVKAVGHIEERRRSSGEITYRLRVHVGGGEYYVESLPAGSSRQDAERQLRKLVVERDNNQLTRGSARRISDLWASYSVSGLSRLSPYTRNGYRDVYRLHIEPGLGNVKVAALTVGQVEDFLAAVMQKGLSWNSVKNVRICLSAMLTFAARRDEGVTLPHVVQRAKMPGEEPMMRTEIPDPAIAATVLRDLIATDLELAAIERVCAITGCRIGEASALRFDDLLGDSIRFDEAVRVERWQGVISVTVGPTKTRTRRTVTIDDTTAAILEAWIKERGKGAPRELLFPGPDGGPNQPGRFSARWKRACARHGLKTHQHLLRHLVGTLTTESLGLRVAQERLGHARVDTTQRYAHVRSSSDVAAAEMLGKALA